MEPVARLALNSGPNAHQRLTKKLKKLRKQFTKGRSEPMRSLYERNLHILESRNNRGFKHQELHAYRINLWKKSTSVDSHQRKLVSFPNINPKFRDTPIDEDSVSDIDSLYIIKCQEKKIAHNPASQFVRLADELCFKK